MLTRMGAGAFYLGKNWAAQLPNCLKKFVLVARVALRTYVLLYRRRFRLAGLALDMILRWRNGMQYAGHDVMALFRL